MFELLLCARLLAAQAADGGAAPDASVPAAPVADVSETAGKPLETEKDAEKAKEKEMGRRTGPVSPASLKEGVRRAREKPARPSDSEAILRQKKESEDLVVRLDAAREKMHAEAERLDGLIKEWDRRHAEGCPVDEGTTTAAAPRGSAARPVAAPRPVPPPPDVEGLAKSLKSMKPKQAANVVERLDRTTAARALKKMSPRSAGGVLAAMTPNAAAEVADAMTQLRDAP